MSAHGDSRAAPDAGGARFRFENVEFNEVEGQLRVAGQPVDVEPRPLRLLAELLRRVNEVVTKEELFESVWEGRPTVDQSLSGVLCVGHSMTTRSMNATQDEHRCGGQGGAAANSG